MSLKNLRFTKRINRMHTAVHNFLTSPLPMSTAEACAEKLRLITAYDKATRAYSNKLGELKRTMGTLSKAEYDAHYRMTEALRQDAMDAHGVLEQHVRLHRC
jgi:hypothetical protein